jgi:hypothetical protein
MLVVRKVSQFLEEEDEAPKHFKVGGFEAVGVEVHHVISDEPDSVETLYE